MLRSTNLEGTPLAGLINPVGVRGRELEPFIGVVSFLPDTLLCLLDVGVLPEPPTMVLRGIRLGVHESSAMRSDIIFHSSKEREKHQKVKRKLIYVPSNDCVDPYRLGGLLPCLDAGRLLGLLAGREAGLDAGLLDGRLPPIKHFASYIISCRLLLLLHK